jgi:hypothetical protein
MRPLIAGVLVPALYLTAIGCAREAGSSADSGLDAGTDADSDTDADADSDSDSDSDGDDGLICMDMDVWYCDPPDGGMPSTACLPGSNCCGHPAPPGDYPLDLDGGTCAAEWNTTEPPTSGARRCWIECTFEPDAATCRCADCFWGEDDTWD